MWLPVLRVTPNAIIRIAWPAGASTRPWGQQPRGEGLRVIRRAATESSQRDLQHRGVPRGGIEAQGEPSSTVWIPVSIRAEKGGCPPDALPRCAGAFSAPAQEFSQGFPRL